MDLQQTGERRADEEEDAGTRGHGEAPAPLLLHVGLHKTGSTWLQDNLFASTPHGFSQHGEPRHVIVERLVTPYASSFDAEEARVIYTPAIDDARSNGRTLVLSHERLSGYPSSGSHDRAMIAARLRETFPDGRVLIVFREQRSLIRSMYSQHITDGGVESLDRFLHRPEPGLGRKPSFCLEQYEFDRMIAMYRGLFGEDCVLALPVELLAKDRQQFADRVTAFCGLPSTRVGPAKRSNEKRPLLMQHVQRPLNMLFYHNELSPGALVHVPRFHKRYARLRPLFDRLSPQFLERRMEERLRSGIERHVQSHYAASNRRTAEMTGLALQDFGYIV